MRFCRAAFISFDPRTPSTRLWISTKDGAGAADMRDVKEIQPHGPSPVDGRKGTLRPFLYRHGHDFAIEQLLGDRSAMVLAPPPGWSYLHRVFCRCPCRTPLGHWGDSRCCIHAVDDFFLISSSQLDTRASGVAGVSAGGSGWLQRRSPHVAFFNDTLSTFDEDADIAFPQSGRGQYKTADGVGADRSVNLS